MKDPKSILLILANKNVTKIKDAIILLTGLKPMEKVISGKYILKLGIVEPIIIKYKILTSYSLDQIRRFALLEMLTIVCNKMVKFKEFIVWSVNNKTFINKQN